MKKTCSMLLALVLMVSLTACGSDNSGSAAQPDSQSQEAAQPDGQSKENEQPAAGNSETSGSGVTLTLMGSKSWFKDVDNEVYQQFEEETGIKVELITNPDDMNNNIMGAKIATKELPDIVEYYNGGTGEAALLAEENFLDITSDPCLENVNQDLLDKFSKWDGVVYGFPIAGAQYWGIYYNKQIFADLNLQIPKTFEDLENACQKIKDQGITPIYLAGGDVWPVETWLDTYWGSYIAAKTTDFWDQYGENKIKLADLPEAVECLERQNDFYKKGYFGETAMSDTWSGQYSALYEGTAAMLVFNDSCFGEGMEIYPDYAEKLGFMPFPVDGSDCYGVTSSNSLYINKNSEHIDEALQLFNFLARPDIVEKMYTAKQQSPWFDNVSIDSLLPQIKEAQEAVREGRSGVSWFDFIPASYGNSSFEQIQEMFLGNCGPADVLKAIDDEIAKNAKAQGIPGW